MAAPEAQKPQEEEESSETVMSTDETSARAAAVTATTPQEEASEQRAQERVREEESTAASEAAQPQRPQRKSAAAAAAAATTAEKTTASAASFVPATLAKEEEEEEVKTPEAKPDVQEQQQREEEETVQEKAEVEATEEQHEAPSSGSHRKENGQHGTSPLPSVDRTAQVVESQPVDSSAVAVASPRSGRRWFGFLSKSTVRRRKRESPAQKRRSAHGAPSSSTSSPANDFLQQAMQFESQVKANTTHRHNDDDGEDDGDAGGAEDVHKFHVYDDPRSISVQLFKKSKHDKKAAAAFYVALNHTLAQTTHPFTFEGELVAKQELDSAGHKSKAHKSFKTYIASLRGCVLTLRASEKDRLPTIGPLYITADGVSRESHKKKGAVIRISALQGTFLVQGKDGAQTAAWLDRLTAITPLVLDCPHYISSEAKDALESFVGKTVNMIPTGDAARLPVVMLGLSGSGKTSIIRALTSQGYNEKSVVEPHELCTRLDLVHRTFDPLVAVMSCNARLGAGVLDIFNVLAGCLPWSEG
ncbi:hypothetical protein PTSG_10881 [Salpingoeca rosetta]|uniref:PH domain-containing protein n=1 Tax=Salpingoeca rosetta (strain ATCC 50818 / BSB-021) TaxID=946362 RepID=F2URA0_SALR5|nr:uncharacterized protein PTSG_10881 [Salpingoeca rosetta]EGD80203.1 hypothetical protein PTSG_10881 [Salpingoeca rosetta]|eukprot:XP_004988265.1 hypothetical protein PTSG_10881 [Salpingoeca rosetta]